MSNPNSSAHLDRGLLLAGLFLIGLGLVQVYSSSFLFATETYEDGWFFFRKQLVFAVLAVVVLLGVALMPVQWRRTLVWLVWAGSALGIVLTLVPGLGIKAGGATRWLRLPLDQRVEPGEFLRVSSVFILAWVLTAPLKSGNTLSYLWRWLLVIVPPCLLLMQPDFGGLVMITLTSLAVVFVAGLRWRYLMMMAVGLAGAATVLIVQAPYRLARVKSFLDPWSDPGEKGFQVIQSMLSFHAGGLAGVGVGQGQGKLFFLPEAHTDFTMAVLAEETGFLGVTIVLFLFGFVIFRGFQIALRNQDDHDRFAALGITLCLGLSVLVNFGVVTGMLPTKGLTMPFLSYGGSSLLASSLAMGLLINLARHMPSRPKSVRQSLRLRRM